MEKPYTCPISFCQKRFQQDSFIGVHIRRHLPETRLEVDVSQYPENPHISPAINNRSKRQREEEARKMERAKKKVTKVTNENETSDEEVEEDREEQKEGEEEEIVEERNICTRCGESVASSKMSIHMRKHKKKQRYTCSDCGRSYGDSTSLKSHHMIAHTKMKLNCPMEGCGKAFKQRTTLRTHILTIHTHRTQHKCSFCEKSFSIKSDLDVHVKGVHEGIKARCSFCGKDFNRPSERNRHQKQVHGAKTPDQRPASVS